MSFKDNYPLTPPTLSLDFVNASGVDPRVTFTRSSDTATFCNSAGLITLAGRDVPRIDYDPITHECKGLLIEESRTNLVTYSEQFDNAAWTMFRASITANTITAPDGTLTGDKLVEDASATNTHGTNRAQTLTDNLDYSFSCFIKAGERYIVRMQVSNKANTVCLAYFNTSTGVVSNVSNATGTMTLVGNGWYRCVLVFNASTGGTTPNFLISPSIVAGTPFYTGDGTSGVYIWGAQLEQGAFPTSYIPTTSAQVTRTADNASMTGTNFSSWYNQSEGTVAVEYDRLSNITASGYPRVYSITDGTLLNEIDAVQQAGIGEYLSINTTGTNQTLIANITVTVGNPIKTASSYATNNVNSATNTILGISDNLATIPAVTRLDFGNRFDGLRPLNGHIKSFKYYPIRLTNAQLQTLTNP